MKKFSVKKLLLTILCSVIISIFIGSTIFFIGAVPVKTQCEILTNLDKDSEVLIEVGKDFEKNMKQLEETVKEHKVIYGEDYPTEGIFLYQLINIAQTDGIITIYIMFLLIGIALGTVIYIVTVQNAKGIELIIELFLAFVVLFVLILLANAGYEALLNYIINNYNPTEIEYQTYIYDLNNRNIVLGYIIIIAIVYIGNMIYQKRQANKLNKELNKK